MPQYEHFTDDQITNLATQMEDLTAEAKSAIQIELVRRNITPDMVRSYQEESSKIEREEMLKIRIGTYRGIGRMLFGKTSYSFDALSGDETFETTLWFVFLYFPLVPIAGYEIRRKRQENWWEKIWTNKELTVLRKLPRNWNQILLTWTKALAIIFVLVLVVRLT